jgi:hypothetical protein
VRIVGQAPLAATVYELERLRCNACGQVFTAEEPEGVGAEKYDETASAMIAQLKYGSGIPFYRLEQLESQLGIPMPAPTQWEVVEEAAGSATACTVSAKAFLGAFVRSDCRTYRNGISDHPGGRRRFAEQLD